MIDSKFHGQRIKNIPIKNFTYGFDPQERFPALVLATTLRVPVDIDESWNLAEEGCDGFGCNSRLAATRPLQIRPEREAGLITVVHEDFEPRGLDYFQMMAPDQNQAIRERYLAHISAIGLTCSPGNLATLTQALYPVDATHNNLQLLSDENIELLKLSGNGDLVIYIVGCNCD